MGRGLYGQSEGHEYNRNAGAEARADIDSEGTKPYDGIKTQAQYLKEMGAVAGQDYTFRQMERKRLNALSMGGKLSDEQIAARAKRDAEVKVAQIKQGSALTELGALVEDMISVGYAPELAYDNLNRAPGVSAATSAMQRRMLAPKSPDALKMRSRQSCKMYSLERDALVTSDGKEIKSIYEEYTF